MSNFNFGTVIANTTGVASDKRLRPYSINKVKFVESKVDVLHSEKTSQDYDILKVRFEGEHGYYEENLFLPSTSGKDIERTPNNWGGENPSNADRAMMFFAHILGVLNADGLNRLKTVIGKAKNFKEVATMVSKLLNEKKGCECYLKLCGRDNAGVIYASLPYYAQINRDGEAYVNNNFLSLKDDLSFTLSEEKKRQEFENAKPTNMNPALDVTMNNSNNSDITDATEAELDSLLGDL